MVNRRGKHRRIKNTRKTNESDDHHQSSESRELIGYNHDLLIEILRRLPAESIVRFKSVSKHWLSLLSHREFTLPYDKLSVLNGQGIFYGSNYVQFDAKNPNQNCPLSRSPKFHRSPRGLRIVQSCNGLLLCCFRKEIERAHEYYVFNPTTKQLAVVRRAIGTRMICFVGLVYHPTVCKHFKIVCMYTESSHTDSSVQQLRVQIYTSDIKKWKLLSDVYTKNNYPSNFLNGVYVNGCIYFNSLSHFNSLYYFNLEEEKLQKLELLCPDIEERVRVYYFGESRGHLHMVAVIKLETRLYLCIYELMSDHSGWVLMFQILIEEIQDLGDGNFEVLDVVRGEKEGDTFMVLKLEGEFRSFNLLKKSYKKLCDVTTIKGRTMEAHRYIQTIGLF